MIETCQNLDWSCLWSVLLFTFLFNIQWSWKQDGKNQSVTLWQLRKMFWVGFQTPAKHSYRSSQAMSLMWEKKITRSTKHCSKQTQCLSESVSFSAKAGKCELWVSTDWRWRAQPPGWISYFPGHLQDTSGVLAQSQNLSPSQWVSIKVPRKAWQSSGQQECVGEGSPKS